MCGGGGGDEREREREREGESQSIQSVRRMDGWMICDFTSL